VKKLKPIQALNEAIGEAMMVNDDVVCFGEDIGDYGGVWALSKGLQKQFGEMRVFDTPLAEAAIVGTAVGAAMAGLRPVIELMYIDFSTIAMDPLVNQMAKIRFMSGGQFSIPVTIVAPCGAGTCEASQHSQSLEAWFLNSPGIKVVMPSTVYDCKGLLRAAIDDDNPVMMLWHKGMYDVSEEVPDGSWKVPLGKAAVRREGQDVTVVSYSLMVRKVLDVANRLSEEIDVEVIDLRSLNPIDEQTVIDSVQKTGALLVVHESPTRCGVGADVVRRVVEKAISFLRCPPRVLGGRDLPIPFAKPLESACIPQPQDIEREVRNMAAIIRAPIAST
jgi:pyruvate dehydrogenase E1 component beta subunit